MAITSEERKNIITLVVGMYDAAPGATYLADLTVAYEANGRSLATLARDLSNTSAYKALNPVFQTAEEFTQSLLAPFGLGANAVARDFVTTKFNAGLSKGQIAYDLLVALEATTDTAFSPAKAILANKVAVAEYYSVNLGVTELDIHRLHAAIAAVTGENHSVATAEKMLDAQHRPPAVGTGSGPTTTTATPTTTTPPGTGTGSKPADDPNTGTGSSPTGEEDRPIMPPGWDSEHMGPGSDSGGPVLVWDNDLEMWVPQSSPELGATSLDAGLDSIATQTLDAAVMLLGVPEAWPGF